MGRLIARSLLTAAARGTGAPVLGWAVVVAMVPAVAALAVAMGGPPLDLFISLPPLGLLAVAIGGVLGWCPLAVGGARG